MQIVIEISEEDYISVKEQVAGGITNPLKMCIAKGTPLRSGKWMRLSIHDWEFDCSECGFDSDEPYPYCPNCGARMIEPYGGEEE